MIKRRLLALFLLSVLSIQWIGGRSVAKMMVLIKVERQMNDIEQVIAADLKDETGIDAYVKIHDEEALERFHSMGYGSPFLFTSEAEGKIKYYTVERTPAHKVELTLTHHPVDDYKASKRFAALDRLFNDFFFEVFPFQKFHCLGMMKLTFSFQHAPTSNAPLPLTPPPKV